jgi:glycerate 2-kinase
MVRNRDELLDPRLSPPVLERRRLALDLVDSCLAAIDPTRAVAKVLDGEALVFDVVLAFGKAAPSMARAALERNPGVRGLVVTPYPSDEDLGSLEVLAGEHPVPGPASFAAGARALSLARGLGDERVLCLVSGGASACLEAPRRRVGPEDTISITRALLAAGAAIEELNTVRCALSAIKNGGLLAAMPRADVVTVVFSDIVGGDVSLVGSGPTLPGRPVVDEARRVLARYGVVTDVPLGDGREEPRGRSRLHTAADNRTAVTAIAAEARRRGVEMTAADTAFTGEAREVGERLYREARVAGALVAGGEATVRVVGSGHGGRAQELVLGGARIHAGGLFLALGTDGIDGRSDSAGALFDEAVRASRAEIDDALAQNDSASFFARHRARIVTGPTGTNVADVAFYLP